MKAFIKRNLNKTFFVFLLFLLSISAFLPVFSQNLQQESFNFKPFKFAFVPDVHLSFEKQDDWILTNESLVILQDTIRQLDKISDLNFVLFGGDLIDKKENKVSDVELLTDLLSELKFPYYVIFGDRDADTDENYTKEDFTAEYKFNGFENIHQSYWARYFQENILLIGLDSSADNSFDGYLPEEEIKWLENVLSANTNKFTIIFVHHPPILDFDEHYRLKNAAEFQSLIKKYPQVKIVLSGHAHRNYTRNIDGTIYIVSPSIVTYPNEYKILTVYPDRIAVDSREISFKQIINKGKKIIPDTDFAKQTKLVKKELFKMLKGDELSRKKEYYFINR